MPERGTSTTSLYRGPDAYAQQRDAWEALRRMLPRTNHLVYGGGFAVGADPVRSATVDLEPYCVTDSTGNQALEPGPTTINLDTETVADATYSLASDTITAPAGTYLISYTIVADNTDTLGNTRAHLDAHMTNGGTPIAQSYSRSYVREGAVSPGAGCSTTFVAKFAAQATLCLIGDINNDTPNFDTVAGRSQVSIIKLA